MKQTSNLICVNCPMGCTLAAVSDQNTVESVQGNRCRKGLAYAQSEISDPKRMLSSTVKIWGGIHQMVPVHTRNPIPRKCIFELLVQLKQIELKAPVEMGQIVLADICGTGVDVIASRDLPVQSQRY
jgi:CxxC motif-containing protein